MVKNDRATICKLGDNGKHAGEDTPEAKEKLLSNYG